MKIGLVICTYNRPEYLRFCYESLMRADLSKLSDIVVVDDCSSDMAVLSMTDQFLADVTEKYEGNILCSAHMKPQRKSIKDSLMFGFDLAMKCFCDVFINLDGDAQVRNDFIDVLLGVHKNYPAGITTGFNCNTLNRDGSVRHKNLWIEKDGTVMRESVGGINMCFSREVYFKYVRPALMTCLEHGGNWDATACKYSMKDSLPVAVCQQSVVQHLGIKSSMGHDAGGEPADVADDFKPLALPNVTLIAADDKIEGIIKAADISCRDIQFGFVKLLSCQESSDSRAIKIRKLGSKKEYSQFIFKEIINFIETDHFIVFQWDGFVLNYKAWDDKFLNYDYIGAPFEWYNDDMKVGNGGLSLRSRKLHQLIQDEKLELCNDQYIKDFAEDHNICRIHRPFLESKGIKFAPVELARKFSIEAWKSHDNKYKGSFGFHGFSVDFSGTQLPYIPYLLPNNERKIF
mgnify:CR=1 FL=1